MLEEPTLRKDSSEAKKGQIWSAVLIASNVPKPKDPPSELRSLAPRLKRVFGYNQFEIVGKDEASIEDGAERKLTPSRAFWIDLKARIEAAKERVKTLEYNWQMYRVLVQVLMDFDDSHTRLILPPRGVA